MGPPPGPRETTPQASLCPSQRAFCPGLSPAGSLASRKGSVRGGHGKRRGQQRERWGTISSLDSPRASPVGLGQVLGASRETGHFTTAPLGVASAPEWRVGEGVSQPPPSPEDIPSPSSEDRCLASGTGGEGGGRGGEMTLKIAALSSQTTPCVCVCFLGCV